MLMNPGTLLDLHGTLSTFSGTFDYRFLGDPPPRINIEQLEFSALQPGPMEPVQRPANNAEILDGLLAIDI